MGSLFASSLLVASPADATTRLVPITRIDNPQAIADPNAAADARFDAAAFCAALAARGVRMFALGPRRVRAVTHLDVDAAGIDLALRAMRDVLASA
jgi:hypothetical protein